MKRLILSYFFVFLFAGAYAQGVMIPSGFGPSGGVITAAVGGVANSAYSGEPDAVASFGLGVGDPHQKFGLYFGIDMLNIDEFDAASFRLKFHRYLDDHTSIAAGAENLLAFGSYGPDSKRPNYYLSVSHFFSGSDNPLFKNLGMTIGAGKGRFSEQSERDRWEGKPNRGTSFFGGLEYDFGKIFAASVDWSGTNMNAGISAHFHFHRLNLIAAIQAADLTRYSGDRVRATGGVGIMYRYGGGSSKKDDGGVMEILRYISQQ